MIIDWSIRDIKSELDKIARAEDDKMMDGFVTFGHKQDLYQILWYVEDKLDKCSTYEGEKEFVKKREQSQMLKTLGKK